MRNKYISYEELEKENLQEYISYSEKLKTIEWAKRHEEILLRDSFTFQKCEVRYSKIIDGVSYINYTQEEEHEYIENLKKEMEKAQKMLGINFPFSAPKKVLHQDFQPKYLHVHHKYYI